MFTIKNYTNAKLFLAQDKELFVVGIQVSQEVLNVVSKAIESMGRYHGLVVAGLMCPDEDSAEVALLCEALLSVRSSPATIPAISELYELTGQLAHTLVVGYDTLTSKEQSTLEEDFPGVTSILTTIEETRRASLN